MSRFSLLGRKTQNSTDTSLVPTTGSDGILEVTLNYPRVPGFIKLNSTEQKNLYNVIFKRLVHGIWPGDCTGDRYRREFEFCKSGHVHLHGWILCPKEKFYIIGIVADTAKRYLNMLPKRYDKYIDYNMCSEFNRYRSPMICIQYSFTTERIAVWNKYMSKHIISNIDIIEDASEKQSEQKKKESKET